jgi:outer membrane translocation and assembly module TamA
LIYGYRFKRFWRDVPLLQLDLSGVTTSIVRDSRDNPLDARKGLFLSLSVDVVPRALGSEVGFQRIFAQTFIHRPVGGPFTWSQGYRVGASHGLNESRLREVDFGHSTEFFRAGGGNSVRGYAVDVLGPVEEGTQATLGGEGVLVINQELRYRHPSGFGGVLFYDLGNAFVEPRDISFKLKHAVGVGLRYTSPVGLLRVDLGFPLNRRSQDKGYQVFFSLGQAF